MENFKLNCKAMFVKGEDMKKLVSGLMLALILIGTLTLAFNIQRVKSESRTIVVPDDYPTIQEAINNANEGDTIFVRSGTYHEHVIVNKTLSIVGENKDTTFVDGDGTDIVFNLPNRTIADKILITGFTIQNASTGVHLHSVRNIIKGNIIKDNYIAVYSIYSNYNEFTDNIIANNTRGMLIDGEGHIIKGNMVTSISGEGIELFITCNNQIINNTVLRCGYGIGLWHAWACHIIGNTVLNNREGIYMAAGCHWNEIIGNTIQNNSRGLFSSESQHESWIYHNNFMNNIVQAISESSLDVWDDGYPSGGNYWSDYSGVDLYSGPYQNETGSDGIGDTPYIIDENNIDRYPLMNPWTPKPPVITATVDIQPQTLNLRSGGKWITAYIELPEGYDVANINVSTILLNDTIPVEPKPIAIGDYDNDTVPDLMVKFDRQQVINYIMANVDMSRLYEERFMTITLTITGKLKNGTPFQGSDTIKIILPMPMGLYKISPI